MNKKQLQLLLIFAILYVAYAVVLFLVNTNSGVSFWLSFAFITVSFSLVVFSYFFVSENSRRKQVVGMPITTLSTMYFALEFILGTILMCFEIVFTWVFVPQFILFVAYALCFVGAMFSENNYKSAKVENQEENKE